MSTYLEALKTEKNKVESYLLIYLKERAKKNLTTCTFVLWKKKLFKN